MASTADRMFRTGHEDAGHGRKALFDPGEGFQAGEPSQHQVEQEDVGRGALGALDPFFPRFHGDDVVAVLGEKRRQNLPDMPLVVDDENLRHDSRNAKWKENRCRRPFPFDTVEPQVATMPADDVEANRESETGA